MQHVCYCSHLFLFSPSFCFICFYSDAFFLTSFFIYLFIWKVKLQRRRKWGRRMSDLSFGSLTWLAEVKTLSHLPVLSQAHRWEHRLEVDQLRLGLQLWLQGAHFAGSGLPPLYHNSSPLSCLLKIVTLFFQYSFSSVFQYIDSLVSKI